MKYKSESDENNLSVRISDIGANRDELLKAFQECQEGRCSCPTDEYAKLDSLAIEQAGDDVQLRLKSKPGARLDEKEIDKCLAFTRDRVNDQRRPAQTWIVNKPG